VLLRLHGWGLRRSASTGRLERDALLALCSHYIRMEIEDSIYVMDDQSLSCLNAQLSSSSSLDFSINEVLKFLSVVAWIESTIKDFHNQPVARMDHNNQRVDGITYRPSILTNSNRDAWLQKRERHQT